MTNIEALVGRFKGDMLIIDQESKEIHDKIDNAIEGLRDENISHIGYIELNEYIRLLELELQSKRDFQEGVEHCLEVAKTYLNIE